MMERETQPMTTSPEPTNQDAYAKKLQARLDQWKAELDKLEATARESEADTKIELERNVDDVKRRWEAARAKALELKKTSGDAWNELRTGTEEAFDSLKDAVERAKSKLG